MSLEIKAEELNRLLMGTSTKPGNKSQKRKLAAQHPGPAKRPKRSDQACSSSQDPERKSSREEDTFIPTENTAVLDPKIATEIIKRIELKNKCTLCVTGLPPKTDIHLMDQLIPDTHTSRIQWNPLTHKCTGVVYVELGSADQAEQYKNKLDGMTFKEKTLSVKTGKFLPENADRYDCRTLVLYGLHHKTHVGEIAKRFPTTTSIKLSSSRNKSDRHRPTLAYLTFPTPQDALLAFDTRQNCMMRRRRFNMSWFLRKTEQQPPTRKCLFVRGLKKSVTETDLQTVFPQATSLTIRPKSGEAFLHYDLEEDCLLDWQNARHLQLFGRKIQVAFHTSNRKPTLVSAPQPDTLQAASNTGAFDSSDRNNKKKDKKHKKRVASVQQEKLSRLKDLQGSPGTRPRVFGKHIKQKKKSKPSAKSQETTAVVQ